MGGVAIPSSPAYLTSCEPDGVSLENRERDLSTLAAFPRLGGARMRGGLAPLSLKAHFFLCWLAVAAALTARVLGDCLQSVAS